MAFPNSLPTANAHWVGNLPTSATAIPETLGDFDAIFASGGKSLITVLYTLGSAVPEGCAVYQLSSDVRDLGRTYQTRSSVTSELKGSLKALLPLLEAETSPRRSAYASQTQQLRDRQQIKQASLNDKAIEQLDEAVITPLVAAQQASRASGSDVTIVDEAIATSLHIRSFLDSPSAKQCSFLRGGALGWGMPATVGCSLGLGREPVVCLVGDGAAIYSPQALWTAAHRKLPVTFVVMNNREYKVFKKFMRSQPQYLSTKNHQFIAMDLAEPTIDYLALSNSMGVPAVRIHRARDVSAAIEAGIASRRPNLVEILIGTEAHTSSR